MKSSIKKRFSFRPEALFWLTVFAVSMGYFEAAVVVYIREVIYPGGFAFPLQPIAKHLATAEIIRELFSLLMLLSVSILAGKTAVRRFAYFMFSFAVWDITYYIFLKLLLNWPESFMTMDILFLLPVTWVGPVIAPLILSVIMVLFALLVLHFSNGTQPVYISAIELFFLITGALVVIVSFTLDYSLFILSNYSMAEIWSLPAKDLYDLSLQYDPERFYWIVFWPGVALIMAGIGLFANRHR